MANNQYVNKVVWGTKTLIDISEDSVSAENLLKGETAHSKSGASVVGTCTFDVDSSGAELNTTVQDGKNVSSELLIGKKVYANGKEVEGTMPNNGKKDIEFTDASSTAEPLKIPRGYHDGTGVITVDKTGLEAENIIAGVTILGITGTHTEKGVETEEGTYTPSAAETSPHVLTPSAGKYFTKVTIQPIPYVEVDNSAGGKTVTIG